MKKIPLYNIPQISEEKWHRLARESALKYGNPKPLTGPVIELREIETIEVLLQREKAKLQSQINKEMELRAYKAPVSDKRCFVMGSVAI